MTIEDHAALPGVLDRIVPRRTSISPVNSALASMALILTSTAPPENLPDTATVGLVILDGQGEVSRLEAPRDWQGEHRLTLFVRTNTREATCDLTDPRVVLPAIGYDTTRVVMSDHCEHFGDQAAWLADQCQTLDLQILVVFAP